MTMSTSPVRMMGTVMTLKGVSSFPFGFSSDRTNRNVRRSSCRTVERARTGVSFIGGSFLRLLLLALHHVVQPEEDRRPQHEDQGDRVQEPRGELRVGRGAQVLRQPEPLRRGAGEVQPAGPADLVLPVDLRVVLLRLL